MYNTYKDKGYLVIPTIHAQKLPTSKNWNAKTFTASDFNSDTGIAILGHNTQAIDVDIYDLRLSNLFKDILVYFLGEDYNYRVGQSPKFLIPFVYSDDTLKKHIFAINKANRIEILATGQYWIAEGIHPDTRKPYYWNKLLQKRSELPILDTECLNQIKKTVEIIKVLLLRSPSNYETWYKTGFSLADYYHHTLKMSKLGLLIFKWWSKRCKTHSDDNRINQQWDYSLKSDVSNPITIQSIMSDNTLRVDLLAHYLDRYVLLKDGTVWDSHSVSSVPQSWANFKLSKRSDKFRFVDDKGKEKSCQMAEKWIDHPESKQAESTNWLPLPEKTFVIDGINYVNTFTLPNHKLPAIYDIDLIRPFLEHMHGLFNTDLEMELTLDWIAHMIQKPFERPSVHLMHCTDNIFGLGRGSLVAVIKELVGFWNVTTIDMKRIGTNGDKFNEYLYHSLLCSISEAKDGKKYDIMENLKRISTTDGDTESIEMKNRSAFPAYVCTRLFIQSNHLDAIPFSENDRRFNLHYCSKDPMSERAITELTAFRKDETAIAHLFKYLQMREIKSYNPFLVKHTSDKKKLQTLLTNPLDHCIDDFLDGAKFIELKLLGDHLKSQNFHVTNFYLGKHLANIGWESRKISLDDTICRRWVPKKSTDYKFETIQNDL